MSLSLLRQTAPLDHPNSERRGEHPNRIRLAYFPSLREIYGPRGKEFVGQEVTCRESGQKLGYRMGNLEALARSIQENRNGIGDLLEIALVVYDDSDPQMRAMGLDPTRRYERENWPWPHDLRVAGGKRVHDVTAQHVLYTPEWKRALRGGNSEDAQGMRAEREIELLRLLMRNGIDLLLTDCATYIFQGGMAMLQRMGGQIVNFHPAVLGRSTAIPGLYPTESAIRRYHRGEILGEGRAVIPVPHLKGYRGHGATLHSTAAAIDQGPVIHVGEHPEMVEPRDTQQTLRHRVFEFGQAVLADGLLKYIRVPEVQHLIRDRRRALSSLT